MPKLQLMGGLASPFTRKARIALAEKGLAFEWLKATPAGEDNPVVARNPLGKIPVLLVDGQAIYDSSVIVEYLEALQPAPPLLPAAGMDRVAVKRWESLGDGICDAGVLYMQEKRRTANQSAEFMARQYNKLKRGMDTAARELGDRRFCHGDAFSLGDIAMGMALGWLPFRLPDYDLAKQYPSLHAYYRRLAERPSFRSTEPTE